MHFFVGVELGAVRNAAFTALLARNLDTVADSDDVTLPPVSVGCSGVGRNVGDRNNVGHGNIGHNGVDRGGVGRNGVSCDDVGCDGIPCNDVGRNGVGCGEVGRSGAVTVLDMTTTMVEAAITATAALITLTLSTVTPGLVSAKRAMAAVLVTPGCGMVVQLFF